MLNAVIKLVPSMVWLVGLLLVAGCLDCLPDPPAVKRMAASILVDDSGPNPDCNSEEIRPMDSPLREAARAIERRFTIQQDEGRQTLEQETAMLVDAANASPPAYS